MKVVRLKDASGCGNFSLHWRPVGDPLLLFFIWAGCCLFDTFPISILNFIHKQKYFKLWGNCLPWLTATTYDLLTYQKIIYYHACYSIHLVWERICIGTAFCPIPLFKCTFDIWTIKYFELNWRTGPNKNAIHFLILKRKLCQI